MIKGLRNHFQFLLLVLSVGFLLSLFQPAIAEQAWKNSLLFSAEIFGFLLPMLLLLELLQQWLPIQTIENHFGKKNGMRGLLIAMLLGSVAAGPLITAFPMADSMLKKGARVANAVIFLGSWSTLKLPMIILESHYLGSKFTVLRLALTIPLILLTGLMMEKFLGDFPK